MEASTLKERKDRLLVQARKERGGTRALEIQKGNEKAKECGKLQ